MENVSILACISNIESEIDRSECEVINALTQAYVKSAMILENYDGDDYSAFEIFQEGVLKDSIDATRKDLSGQNIFMKIIKFIPKLLMNLIRNIKRSFPSKEIDSLKRELDDLHRLTAEQKKELDQLKQMQSTKNQEFEQRFDDLSQRTETPDSIKERLNKHEERIDRLDMRSRQMGVQISFTNEVVYFNFNFEQANEYLNQMSKYIESLAMLAKDPQSYNRSAFQALFNFFANDDPPTIVKRLGYKSVKASFFDAKRFMEEYKMCSVDMVKRANNTIYQFENIKNADVADGKTVQNCSEIIDVLQKVVQLLTGIQNAVTREVQRVHAGIRIMKEANPLPMPKIRNHS